MNGELVVVRHADTDWTVSGQHTGRSNIPLNDAGRERAAGLRERLAGRRFTAAWSSPLSRALETAQLAGFTPELRDELMEWDYGDYDGMTTDEILTRRPGWDLWRDGCPGGEQAADVGGRADALLASLPPQGDQLVFSHGHMLRVLTARWLGLPPQAGALVVFSPASIGVLGYEHGRRVLRSLD